MHVRAFRLHPCCFVVKKFVKHKYISWCTRFFCRFWSKTIENKHQISNIVLVWVLPVLMRLSRFVQDILRLICMGEWACITKWRKCCVNNRVYKNFANVAHIFVVFCRQLQVWCTYLGAHKHASTPAVYLLSNLSFADRLTQHIPGDVLSRKLQHFNWKYRKCLRLSKLVRARPRKSFISARFDFYLPQYYQTNSK